MKLLEQVELKLDWLDASTLHEHPYPQHKRSTDKVHVTDILRYIAVESKKLDDSDRDDEMPVCVLLGMGWEMACARLYPEMWWQPGEFDKDRVIGSPDGLSVAGETEGDFRLVELGLIRTGESIIDEFKYTKKSMRKPGGSPDEMKDLNSEWLWAQQVLSYMAMSEYNIRLVRFHVLWSRGNYDFKGGGNKERYVRYLLRAEDREVESTWRMIMNHKEAVCKQLRSAT